MILEIKHKGNICQVIYDDAFYDIVSNYTWHISKGYARASLPKDENGKRHSIQMHQLLLTHTGKHTHHVNENRLDNRLSNLRGMSVKEHFREHIRTQPTKNTKGSNSGWFQSGQSGINSKLTDEKVIKIRELYKNGLSTRKLAEMFNISKSAMWSITSRDTWKHI